MLALIYGHALALKLKGVPVHPHPRAAVVIARIARGIVLGPAAASRVGQLTVVEDGREPRVRLAARPQATVARARPARVAAARCAAAAAWREAYVRRPVGLARPHRGDPRRGAQRRRASTTSAAGSTPVREPFQRARAAFVRNTPRAQPQGHRRPLRPRQRAVRADARPDDDVLVRASSSAATRRSRRRRSPSSSCVCDKLDLGAARPRARDRHRLGRLRRPRRDDARLPRDDDDDLARAARLRGARACARPGVEDRVRCCSTTTATCAARYDKLVSIEMIEAVGWKDFGTFFERCSDLLAPDGAMLLQAITIDDRAYEVEKASQELHPHATSSRTAACRRCEVIAALRRARAPTCAWSTSRTSRRTTPRRCGAGARTSRRARTSSSALGYDERFRRLWRMYLALLRGGLRRAPDRARADRARQAAGRRASPRRR